MSQKQASYSASGSIIAYYDTVDSPAPSTANVIDITDDEWLTCISTPGYTVVNGALVAPADPTSAELLAAAQTAQTAILSASCETAIESSFTSSALGSEYTYPSTIRDQLNLRHVADSASGGALWCESGSTWAHTEHTQAQAQAASESFVVWLNDCQLKLVMLTAQVNDATTVDAVSAINWASTSDCSVDASGVDASGVTSLDASGA